MATSTANGSQTATIDTEHTLSTVTDAGTYVLAVDLSNLANGDIVVLRVKTKVRSVGTTRLAYQATFSHAQADLVTYSIPAASPHEWVATLEQTDGTGRAFAWEVIEV